MAERELAGVSRETQQKLTIYAQLLIRWQKHINLVADQTIPALWTRHFADSLQLRTIAPTASRWIDLGSGAGFPGLVVAIDLGSEPGASVHLIESNSKKVAFLREVVRETDAPATVVQARIEDVLAGLCRTAAPDVISARALAPLTTLLDYAGEMLKTPTRALFLKGQDIDTELTRAAKYWNLKYIKHPSGTEQRGCVIEIQQATRI